MKKALVALNLLLFVVAVQAQIHLASGIEGEIYAQFAKDINNNTAHELSLKNTEGSLDNIELLTSGDVNLAFVQYDVLLYKELEEPSVKEYIKIFLPLYEEEIHLISKNNGVVQTLEDLQGKRVGVGNKKSGTSVTAQFIRLKTGLEWTPVSISFERSFAALLSDSIDAFFYVGAAPSNKLKNLSADLSSFIRLVPVRHPGIDNIYREKTIDSETYPWLTDRVKTYSVKSLLAVNTSNLSSADELQMDSLYEDLSSNLAGIQRNKFSHTKWQQVDFSEMKSLDWPVFKQQYVTRELIIDIMAILAAVLSFIQIYFIVNKLWKRKHERVVAESISISAMFISILINGFFAIKNLGTGQVPQLSANLMWIASSVISAMIGVGFWVLGNKQKGFGRLLLAALNLERKEAGDLAKAFFRPSGADEIIDILGQLAMIDDDLDEREREFIQSFADNWGIEMDWEKIALTYGNQLGNPYDALRASLKDYLATAPPKEQVSQLADVVHLLVNIDNVVTEEEELIQSEMNGQIAKYLGEDAELEVYKVAVVPQSEDQDAVIENQLKEHLTKEHVAGGYAYLSEPYFSERYAEIISNRYRSLNVFAVVVKPNHILSVDSIKEQKVES